MNTKTIQKYLSYATRVLAVVLISLIIMSGFILEATKKPPEVRKRMMDDLSNQVKIQKTLPKPWPPQMNKPYADITLVDQEGKPFRLSKFRGKIIILENIDMTMPESQALSGAARYGVFGDTKIGFDKTLKPIEDIIGQYSQGKIKLPNPEIMIIKIIYYGPGGAQPVPADAVAWANHFKLSKQNNVIVAITERDMRATFTSVMTPGYQLIDRAFNLRVDSSGLQPKHSLELTFIPLIPKLL